MARLFDGSNDYLENTAAVATAEPVSIAAWFRSDDATILQTVASVSRNDTARNSLALVCAGTVVGDPVRANIWGGGFNASASTSSGYSANVWHHGLAVFTASNDRAAYIDGGSKGTNGTSRTVSSIDTTNIGCVWFTTGPARTEFFSGDIAEVAIWNAALTDAEALVLAKGYSPLFVRPASLVAYWPLIGRTSPEVELVGGFTATVSGAVVSNHPRIIYPRRRSIIVPSALSGAIAGTADLVFGVGSSTLTGAGALAGTASLAFGEGTSTLTGAGALAGAAALTFGEGSSTLAGAGALTGTAALTFGEGSSTLTGAGALAGAAALQLDGSGTLTGAGALAGAADLVIGGSGTLAGAGALTGSAALSLTGAATLSGSGALAGAAALTFDGSAALLGAGALVGSAALALTGLGDLTSASALVTGVPHLFEGLGYTPGAKEGSAYTPGLAAGRGYAPGLMEGDGYTPGLKAGGGYVPGAKEGQA